MFMFERLHRYRGLNVLATSQATNIKNQSPTTSNEMAQIGGRVEIRVMVQYRLECNQGQGEIRVRCIHVCQNWHQPAFNFTRMNLISQTLQISHQHHILAYNYVGYRFTCRQQACFVKISENCHQHNDISNITVTPK